MTDREQIEEMATDICEICRPVTKCKTEGKCMMAYITAKQLISKGYRKQVEAKWHLVCNGFGVCLNCNRMDAIDPISTHCRYCGARMKGGE